MNNNRRLCFQGRPYPQNGPDLFTRCARTHCSKYSFLRGELIIIKYNYNC